MCVNVYYGSHPEKSINLFSEYDQGASGLGAILHPGFQEQLRKFAKQNYEKDDYNIILSRIPQVPFLLQSLHVINYLINYSCIIRRSLEELKWTPENSRRSLRGSHEETRGPREDPERSPEEPKTAKRGTALPHPFFPS